MQQGARAPRRRVSKFGAAETLWCRRRDMAAIGGAGRGVLGLLIALVVRDPPCLILASPMRNVRVNPTRSRRPPVLKVPTACLWT